MSKVKAVAASIVLMLCASVSYAQLQSANAGSYVSQTISPNNNSFSSINRYTGPSPAQGQMYVACWAEVPSQSTAYFTATFEASAVSSARKEFRQLVTTQYGRVSNLRCAGKFSQTVVNELVEKWKDTARAATNAIVDTDWQPTAALREPGPSSGYLESLGARMKRGTAVEMEPFPHSGGLPPGQGGPATVASQSNGQRY